MSLTLKQYDKLMRSCVNCGRDLMHPKNNRRPTMISQVAEAGYEIILCWPCMDELVVPMTNAQRALLVKILERARIAQVNP